MGDTIHVETPDAASAARLMAKVAGRFPAELVERRDGRWEADFHADSANVELVLLVIAAVQRWLDEDGVHEATLRHGDRSRTIRSGDGRPRAA
jgi:hypothetical protein